MKLVADTSALLSLACSKFLEEILENNEIIITQSVMNELNEFARYADFLGIRAKEVLSKKLVVKNPKQTISIGLEQAESEVISLALEHKCIALTDDAHAARVASEKLKFNAKPSFYLLLLLYKKNKISKTDLINEVQLMLRRRNWLSGALWEYAISLMNRL